MRFIKIIQVRGQAEQPPNRIILMNRIKNNAVLAFGMMSMAQKTIRYDLEKVIFDDGSEK